MGGTTIALSQVAVADPDAPSSLAGDVAAELAKHPRVQGLIKEQAKQGAPWSSWALLATGVGIGLALGGIIAVVRRVS